MATATKNQNKTSFVQDFLSGNPMGNVKAVNEAWADAGMRGSIGATLVNKTRSDMGLTGNLRAKSKPATASKPKSATKLAKGASSPGKTMFVKEFLHDHPQSNVDAVNDAWQGCRIRRDHQPDTRQQDESNTRSDWKPSWRAPDGCQRKGGVQSKNPSRPRTETAAATKVQPRASRSNVLIDLEADIDRLIFKSMAIGDLTEIEESLRQARRLLYGAMAGR